MDYMWVIGLIAVVAVVIIGIYFPLGFPSDKDKD